MNFQSDCFFWQTVLFVGLIFLLRKFAWKPILNAVNEREEKIQGALKAAEEAEKKMQALNNQSEALLKQAREERDQILKEAREAREAIISEAKGKASAEADKIIAQARETINNEKLAAITELKNQVAVLSIEIAEKILKEQLNNDDKQKAIVDNLLKEVNLN
ncbi:MAG: ATP synthase subunit b [Bacteroidia bacterium]|nr:MAG: ATP synthase subunit b [Bacteroidia bacterium]